MKVSSWFQGVLLGAIVFSSSCTGSDSNPGRTSALQTIAGNASTGGLGTTGTGGVATGTGGQQLATGGALTTTGGMLTPTGGAASTGGVMPVTGGMVATGGDMTTGGAMPPMTMTGDLSNCPAAPDGASDAAIQALAEVNTTRVAAGSGCITMVLTLNTAAQNHCDYYAMNSQDAMCTADGHSEVMSCAGFTGASPGDRMKAAGYSSRGGWSEVMAFYDDPVAAVAGWLNSVWHRIPIIDPWTTEMGYGGATGCDTIDFGGGMSTAPDDTVVVYPYDGQIDVPTQFDGSHEGPMPPAPTTGWPSSSPISITAKSLSITEHTLTLDGDTTPIDHYWLDSTTAPDATSKSLLGNTAFMYGNEPFAANTAYRVTMVGTYAGGALNITWTFTTGAASRFGF